MPFRSPIAALLLLALSVSADARPIQLWSPDELAGKAEVIVNAEVVSQKATDEKINLLDRPEFPTKVIEATVKTVHPLKGEVPPTFTFRFGAWDSDAPIVDGPVLIRLQDGHSYRFYLKKQGEAYVNVLHGDIDDFSAVQELPPGNEKLSPILENEAVTIARQVVQRLRPANPIVDFNTSFMPYKTSEWTCTFYCKPPLSVPSFSYDAEIMVGDQRKISPRSWVGRESPREAGEFSKDDIGPLVRLTVKGDISSGEFRAAEGNITSLLGHITSVTDVALRGRFTSQWARGEGEREVSFPRAALASVQRLFSPEEIAEAAKAPAPAKPPLPLQIAEVSDRADASTTPHPFYGRAESLPVSNTPLLTEADIQKTTDYSTGDSHGLILLLQPEATKKLDTYIEAHSPVRLAIVAEGQVLLAPKLTSKTGGRIRLPAVFTEAEANRFVEGLNPPPSAAP